MNVTYVINPSIYGGRVFFFRGGYSAGFASFCNLDNPAWSR